MLKLIPLLLLTSCSYFIDSLDSSLIDDKEYLKNVPERQTFCPQTEKVNFQLVGANPNSQAEYYEMLSKLENRKLDFLDQFALWSLAQMTTRPDQSSPTARLQLLINYNNKTHYFDFFSEETNSQYPYLYGIDWTLKKFGKKTKLETYAAIIEQYLVPKLKVGTELEKFFRNNKEQIRTNPELLPYFFRGTEILKENERTPALNYQKVLSIYRKAQEKQKIIINTSLTPFVTASGSKGSCNYDFNLYDNSIFLIDKAIPVANIFGLSTKENSFLASSSQKIDTFNALNGLPLLAGESKVRSSAVCVIEDESKKIWTLSNQSRDPGQHLFHLIRYGLPKSSSPAEVDKLIRHSRHLFLSDPVRLVIESHRSKPEQIENLLKLNLPIYNAERLGNIWAYTSFNSLNRFILDDRNNGAFLCK